MVLDRNSIVSHDRTKSMLALGGACGTLSHRQPVQWISEALTWRDAVHRGSAATSVVLRVGIRATQFRLYVRSMSHSLHGRTSCKTKRDGRHLSYCL